jgi:uncharacterized protein YndB with AHSA1/START domain
MSPSSQSSVSHGSFTIQRTYPVPAHELFEAWASHAAKARWFASSQDFLASHEAYTLDFRVGGIERLEGRLAGGRPFRYVATHRDIVPDRRIVMDYEVEIDGRRISVSLMTADISPAEAGSTLVITEQGVFLDGLDDNAQRELGGLANLDSLERYVAEKGAAVSAS